MKDRQYGMNFCRMREEVSSSNAAESLRIRLSLSAISATGFLLVVFGGFGILLGFLEPHGRHGAGGLLAMSTLGAVTSTVGIGFLVRHLLTKFISALVLAGEAIYLFSKDAFRQQNWWIYSLLLIPLLLMLSLRGTHTAKAIRKMSHAN